MDNNINLDDLIVGRSANGGRFGKVIAAKRRQEQSFRANRIRYLAEAALKRLHADDYAELMRQATDKVNAERGPLPGDD